MKNKTETFYYTYDVLPADWRKFVTQFKKEPNIIHNKGTDENGDFEFLYDKSSDTNIGKWYDDEMEFVTDIPKVDFYKFQRGQKVDIYKYIKEHYGIENVKCDDTLKKYLTEKMKNLKGDSYNESDLETVFESIKLKCNGNYNNI